MPEHFDFPSREALDRALAQEIGRSLEDAMAARGEATLVVSGGSTPAGVFAELSQLPLDWESVLVLLADERWVPPAHADSNEAMVHRLLLTGPAAAAHTLSLLTEDSDPAQAEAVVAARLQSVGTFDVVLLGMGDDGHFASLFPDSEAMSSAIDPQAEGQCIAVTPPSAPHRRMSLTLSRLLDSRRLILHITGEGKREVLSRAQREGDPQALPVAALLEAATELEVYWAP